MTALAEKREVLQLVMEKERRIRTDRLVRYVPYPKQAEFHAMKQRERALIAANQVGKTMCAGMELAMHLTGRYPDGWNGRVYNRPIVAIVGSKSGQPLRDGAQRILFGRPDEWGTGALPQASIANIRKAQGFPDLIDSATVKHVHGMSTLIQKTYDQGRERWQAETVDEVWMDEEPPEDIYTEALTRTNATRGRVSLTLTPLLGMSSVVRRFLMETSPDRAYVSMTLEDAPHYDAEQRAQIIASYPLHEMEARTKGIPTMGSGRIFPVAESEIAWDSHVIPKDWALILALDFGWDHPTAAVKLAWDRDADVVYVIATHRQAQAGVIVHAAALRGLGGDKTPIAWPHDGLQHDKGSGDQLADQYRQQGLNMLSERATFDDGTSGVEAGISEMLERMQTGRLKVSRHLSDWFSEFHLYHRKDGKIVKEGDDLMSATRYGLMMLRHAKAPSSAPISLGLDDYAVAY